MKITVLYVGSSLLAPLKKAEQSISDRIGVDLRVATYNFGTSLSFDEWTSVETDLGDTDVVFVIHVMDGENATRLVDALERRKARHHAVVVINCMPDLMRRTRMGKLDISRYSSSGNNKSGDKPNAKTLLSTVGSWMGRHVRKSKEGKSRSHTQYLQFIEQLPAILKFVPTAGALTDAKHYLNLFCYFLQPTPANIESMLLYALKQYVPEAQPATRKLKLPAPEQLPAVAIYHPGSSSLFSSFDSYEAWYSTYGNASLKSLERKNLDPTRTIGLLLMRPQVVSGSTKHYDKLILEIEEQGLDVIPAIATLMDNREAVNKFFVTRDELGRETSRVSQILSLTGFSFVGGPAMNDSAAASEFLTRLDVPYRSAVSLDTQSIESWRESLSGLNPVQTGMQIAIPEIDGATEPMVFGGLASRGQQPVPLADRCTRLARRLRQMNKLQEGNRSQLHIAVVLFCFPPNKGNIGTAADLDVFPSVWDLLCRLKSEGYDVVVPDSVDALRNGLLGGNAELFGTPANVVYRMDKSTYRRTCDFVDEVEDDWGRAPGAIGTFGGDLLIQGIQLGKIFIGIQPTFGLEGDPMRLMMSRSGSPHHGFMAFYSYISSIFKADAVIHVGTHGALEFMPGKQVGLSGECWPDRLVGELPNFYLYSVNNPSEGSIAKRRSYAELISYLTPPMENAGLYKGLAQLRDLIVSYRQSSSETERERLFEVIESLRAEMNFDGI